MMDGTVNLWRGGDNTTESVLYSGRIMEGCVGALKFCPHVEERHLLAGSVVVLHVIWIDCSAAGCRDSQLTLFLFFAK